MNKEQIRALLGQLIQLQEMINAMERDGFSWETVQTIKDNLRLMIMDLEKSLDWIPGKQETQPLLLNLYTTNDYELRHFTTYFTLGLPALDDVCGPFRETGGPMKHANEIFPAALTELLAIGEKARQQRETRAKDTRNGGRETARVKGKEKRAKQALLQFNWYNQIERYILWTMKLNKS